MKNGEYNQLTELLSNRNNLHIIFAKSREKDNSSIFEKNDFCRIIDKQKRGCYEINSSETASTRSKKK